MEHVQEFWPQRRPMRTRPQATIAQRKGIFTFLSEGTFTKLPDNNIINLYQTFIEGVLVAEKKRWPSQPGLEFSRLFKTVWESFGMFQMFHTAGEVNRLVRWALRDLKRQGRIQRTHKGRYYASPPSEQAVIGCRPPAPSLPPSQRFMASRWSSQRRHLVSTTHRWDQYNQRRSQRLARAPELPVGPGPGLGVGHVPGPAAVPMEAVGGAPRIRPRLEPPAPPRPMSAPALSALYGRVPRLFPGS